MFNFSFPLLFIFIFGLNIGSFLNVVIYRLNTGESFLKGRSHCPYCNHILSWKDLVPVFSFLFLKGKCRYCHKKISWQYILVELGTALLFSFIFISYIANGYQEVVFLLYQYIIACLLIVIFVFDLRYYLISDKIIHLAVVIALAWQIFQKDLCNPVLSAFLAAGLFLSIVLVSKEKWMGFGDVKLAFFMGLFLGFPDIITALFLACLIGAIFGILLIIIQKKTMKSALPFGPFLVLGTLIAFFWGAQILNWYTSLLSCGL